MTFLIELIFVLLVSAFVIYLEHEKHGLTKEICRLAEQAHTEAAIAQRRLYLAWKDGYTVPPLPDAAAVEADNTVPLIPVLQELVDDWESPQARAAQQAVIQQQLAMGKTQMEVYNALVPQAVDATAPETAVEVGQ